MARTSGDGGKLGLAAARRLARMGVCEIGPGLTDAEFATVEREYGVEFADDHRAFLAAGLPFSSRPQPDGHVWEWPWPDWRNGDAGRLHRHIDWPADSVLIHVESGGLWHRIWGDRPASPGQAAAAARHQLSRLPPMIPVFAHRFLPGGRGTSGLPVLSIWHAYDIVIYGANLDEYIQNELGGGKLPADTTAAAAIPFWGDFLQPADNHADSRAAPPAGAGFAGTVHAARRSQRRRERQHPRDWPRRTGKQTAMIFATQHMSTD